MKKLIIVGFSAALLAGGFSSCKKTSKGKMANEWTVSALDSKDVATNSNGTETVVLTVSDKAISVSNTDSDGEVTKAEGDVQELTYTIEKDGTWSSVSNITLTATQIFSGVTVTSTDVITNTASGTWNFLGNVEDFKKNERVVFNTLNEDEKTVNTVSIPSLDDEVTTTTNKYSYANGEQSKVYLVVESKKKELQLSYEENYTNSNTETTSNGTTNSAWSSTLTESMTLVQE